MCYLSDVGVAIKTSCNSDVLPAPSSLYIIQGLQIITALGDSDAGASSSPASHRVIKQSDQLHKMDPAPLKLE